MFRKQIREELRRQDVRCAQRARWLGMRRPDPHVEDSAEEIRRRFLEEARQMHQERPGFNR